MSSSIDLNICETEVTIEVRQRASTLLRLCVLTSSIALVSLVGAVSPSAAQDLSHLSISELMQLDITSVSKKKEKAHEAAAAVFVITSEDIRRSGATSIPEALRMAPGVHVARIDANTWAISARGFNSQFANKLLVLIDGRTSYTPLFSGVFWDAQDTLLEDIDRIEIIRGPGATLWGANAMNGVINIITKNAADTQGLFVSGGAGVNEEIGFAETRYGSTLGDDTSYRAYMKYFIRDDFEFKDSSESADDSWWSLRSGFRSDTELTVNDTLMITGDAFHNEKDEAYAFEPIVNTFYPESDRDNERQDGANILARWNRVLAAESDLTLQGYYEYSHRDDLAAEVRLHTYDLEFQHRFPLMERHDLIWGLGWRLTDDKIESSPVLSFSPDERKQRIYSAFVQDEVELVEDTLDLIIGTKFEEHTFTGLEIQPNARLLWKLPEETVLWAAISRAVRTPSRTDESASFPSFEVPASADTAGLPLLFSGQGNSELEAENLLSYEVGVRKQLSDTLLVDLSAFFFDYSDVNSAEANEPTLNTSDGITYADLLFDVDNNLSAETYGIEATVEYRPIRRWRLVGSYSYSTINLYGSNTTDSQTAENGIPIFVSLDVRSPEHQADIRSLFNIRDDLQFDSRFHFTETHLGVDSIFDLDLRLGWQITNELEVALVGRNLIEGDHMEKVQPQFGQGLVEVPRSGYVRLTWKM